MKYSLSLFVILCFTTRFGFSQFNFPSRQYIPSNGHFNTFRNHPIVNSNGNLQHSINPYATNQRNIVNSLIPASAPNVVKSVYFFESKPEDEETRVRIRFPTPQKKTRVIFIKAPETKIVHEVIPPPPAEERTVVYVLSKKLEPLGSITIPSKLVTTVKKKPEVYYIKYRDLQHARQLLADSLKGRGDAAAVQTHQDADSFVKTLASDSQVQFNGNIVGATSNNANSFHKERTAPRTGYGKPGVSGPY